MAVVTRASASALALVSLLIVGCDDDDNVIIVPEQPDAAVVPPPPVPDAPTNVNGYERVNLASDQAGIGRRVDPDLVNSWGIVASTEGLWIANAETGKLSVLDANGDPARIGTGTFSLGEGITGIAENFTNQLVVGIGGVSAPARFLVASETGKVFAVDPARSLTARAVAIDRSGQGAIYKGIAIGNSPAGNARVFVADFHNARVDVFDDKLRLLNLTNSFNDPNLPAGYAPFNVFVLRDRVYVTYAKQDADRKDDVQGPGFGFIDVYDVNGQLIDRLLTDGLLNAPWGMAFGPVVLANASGNFLVVGNFGDGGLIAIDPATKTVVGRLNDPQNGGIGIDGLWGIAFGNGLNGTDPSAIYFAAGPDDEAHGVYGRLEPRIVR